MTAREHLITAIRELKAANKTIKHAQKKPSWSPKHRKRVDRAMAHLVEACYHAKVAGTVKPGDERDDVIDLFTPGELRAMHAKAKRLVYDSPETAARQTQNAVNELAAGRYEL